MDCSFVAIGRKIIYWNQLGEIWTAVVHDQDALKTMTHFLVGIQCSGSGSPPESGSEEWLRLDSENMTWRNEFENSKGCSFQWLDSEQALGVCVSSINGTVIAELQTNTGALAWDLARHLHTIDAEHRYFTLVMGGMPLDPASTLENLGVTGNLELTAVAANHGVGRQVQYWNRSGQRWTAKIRDYDGSTMMTHYLVDIQDHGFAPWIGSGAPWSGSEEWLHLDIDAMTWADNYGNESGCVFKWLDE